ncbi:uncharacterized protein C19orf44 homolog [Polypterus senegalus]|uniref:uncharacterized protein C19orf44 homolog n=1 Tax=Polypterus senegalus TaxID=55291 RepID=UPI00196623B3|nr:uncharacterized protein C19orf44 homolog [Polypterus senegalus]XP_039622947.1 uncharacterized protein C19orf44 homolog [Polypterus senegalus]
MWNQKNQKAPRSSALARAQAQLSGQRVRSADRDNTKDELQEYMEALTRKTRSLRESQNLDGFPGDDPDLETKENQFLRAQEAFTKLSVDNPFLKKAPQVVKSSQPPAARNIKPGPGPNTRSSTSAALNKVAQIESRIKNRRLASAAAASADRDMSLMSSDELPFSAHSSGDYNGRGDQFLKRKPQALKQQAKSTVATDSDEEDMKKLLGSSVEMSEENRRRPFTPQSPEHMPFLKLGQRRSTTPLHRNLHQSLSRSPSPPSKGSPRHPGFRMHSMRTPSPRRFRAYSSLSSPKGVRSPTPTPPSGHSPRRVLSPRARLLRRSSSSLSTRSDARSVEDLYAEAGLTEDKISEQSESSDDFKMNIMTIDDLEPALEEKVKTDKSDAKRAQTVKVETTQGSRGTRVPDKEKPRIATEHEATYESDFESEIPTEKSISEISEHLGVGSPADSIEEEVSKEGQSLEGEEQSDSDSNNSRSEAPSSQTSRSSSHSSNSSSSARTLTRSRSGTPAPCKRPKAREIAVQTQTPGFAYSWARGDAVLRPSVGMSYVDPTPIASHAVSPDAIEALTAYSPAVFALNDMLRQQLALTRQFIESSQQMYSSVLQSLGPDDYHYTTLEETKQFIQSHKPPELTVGQALKEVLQEMKEYHYI